MRKKDRARHNASTRKHKSSKHAAPLHVEMPFDEFVARIVRVKPEKKTKK